MTKAEITLLKEATKELKSIDLYNYFRVVWDAVCKLKLPDDQKKLVTDSLTQVTPGVHQTINRARDFIDAVIESNPIKP